MALKKIFFALALAFVLTAHAQLAFAHETGEESSEFEEEVESLMTSRGPGHNDLSVLFPWKHVMNGNWTSAIATTIMWVILIAGMWNLSKVVLSRLLV